MDCGQNYRGKRTCRSRGIRIEVCIKDIANEEKTSEEKPIQGEKGQEGENSKGKEEGESGRYSTSQSCPFA